MTRLGASITDYLGPVDLDTYIRECVDEGYRAAPCPVIDPYDTSLAKHVKDEFAKSDIVISETAAWVNALDPDPDLRKAAREQIISALALADELGAACCATVSGSFATADTPDSHVGQHPENFTPEAIDAVVEWVRLVLDEVRPSRTFLTLEMTPWAVVDTPTVYREVLAKVDDPGLAVHLDPANSITSPRAMFDSASVITDLFDQLGHWVKACHAKDVTFVGSPAVVSIEEVPPLTGYLDYRTFLRLAGGLDPDVPLIMEHLPDRATYSTAGDRIRALARELSISV
jgi:sugar phosphate isomerase/epimerase